MESTNTRVLAYQLAKIIPDDMLQDVSGGSQHMTFNPTFGITSPSGATNACIDYSVDGDFP